MVCRSPFADRRAERHALPRSSLKKYRQPPAADGSTGRSGVFADATNVTFDDFKAYGVDARSPLMPRSVAAAKTSAAQMMDPQLPAPGRRSAGLPQRHKGTKKAGCTEPFASWCLGGEELLRASAVCRGRHRDAVAAVDRFQDDDYTVLVDVTMNGGCLVARPLRALSASVVSSRSSRPCVFSPRRARRPQSRTGSLTACAALSVRGEHYGIDRICRLDTMNGARHRPLCLGHPKACALRE